MRHSGFVALLWSAAAVPALAQNVLAEPDDLRLDGDRITIALGIANAPSYSGSDNSEFAWTAAIEGRISGISFNASGKALYVDVVPKRYGRGWTLQLGPLGVRRTDRAGNIEDSAVAALGKRKTAWEAGGWMGIRRTGVITSAYDTLSFSTSYQQDLGNAHESYIIRPKITYGTPLSTTTYVNFSFSAHYVGKGFGTFYYDIDPAGSAASGLPTYNAARRAGWYNWEVKLLAAKSVFGNLTHGLNAFLGLGYARILGRYRRSPIVDMVGTASQPTVTIGMGYRF